LQPVNFWQGTIFSCSGIENHRTDPHVIQLLQTEFASACVTKLISADHTIVRSRDQLREVVSKASNYLSIGLEVLTQEA
jgi:hypothetical protein